MQCPKCQHVQDDEISCGSCGIYFEKWRLREAEINDVKTTIYAVDEITDSKRRAFGLAVLAISLLVYIAFKPKDDDTIVVAPATAPAAPAPQSPPTVAQPIPLKPSPSAEFNEQLRSLRQQQSQLQMDLSSVQRTYSMRTWPGRDEAQLHAEQIAQQQREQEIMAQLDSIRAQINFLITHPQ